MSDLPLAPFLIFSTPDRLNKRCIMTKPDFVIVEAVERQVEMFLVNHILFLFSLNEDDDD